MNAPQMRAPQAELMLAMRSSISRSAADGGRGSCAVDGACSGAALARLHPLLLPPLPAACRGHCTALLTLKTEVVVAVSALCQASVIAVSQEHKGL